MRHARLGAGLLFILIPVLAQSQIMPTRPYESSDWNLAWQAFLGGGDIQAAYALARTAVAAQPRSVQWRHRLALAAEQSGHPGTALGAYDWLIMHAGQTEYLDKALNLASGLNDASRAVPLMLLALRLRPYSEQRWIATLGELLKLGEYPRALRLLQAADRQHPRRFFLWEQVVLYQQMGEPGHELQTLDIYRHRYGPEPKVMLQIATLQYLQGDYQKAYTSLKAARAQATPQDTAYWRTLSGLAWLLEDYPVAGQASEVLYKANTADPDDYRRLYLIHLASEPYRAFEIALAGWRHTHESSLFFAALSVANAANKPAWLRQAFTHLNQIDTQNLNQHPLYWTSLAMLHASQGRMALAQRAYAQAMALRPDDDRLWADDLWMLIDASDQTRLRALLPRLAAHAINRPALWAPLAAGFGLIGQPDDALPFLNRMWAKRSRDPAWLSDYADTIALAGYPQLAQRLRRAALQTLAANPTEPANIGHRQRLLASLATHLLPGDPAYRWVARLARHPQDARAREQVLGWTLQNDDIGATRSWQRQAYSDTPIPAWARLSFALKTDDASTQAQLLSRDLNALPRQDAASAAENLGWTPLATQLVFDGMRGTPNTDRWQQSFRPLALGGSDTLGATGSLMRASGLSVAGTRLSARHWLNSGLSLTGNIDAGMQSIYDHTQLGTIPGWSRQGSLNLTRTLPRGSASLSLGGGHNLDTYLQAGARWDHRWSRRLSTSVLVDYGAIPTASIPLQLGGLEDRIGLDGNYALTTRDSLGGSLHLGEYRAQGGGYLGSTAAFSLAFDHQFWLSPPNYRISASISGAQYGHAAHLPAQLTTLVPLGQTPAIGFFVPRSYIQACAGGGFNDRYQVDYTSQLRPFLNASVCTNTDYGPGYSTTAGIALPLLGPDHLSIGLQLGTNLGAAGGATQTFTVAYRYYFKPVN